MQFSILSVGSLLQCKGMDLLIDACATLKQQGIPFHCTIAGGGREEKSLQALVDRKGLSDSITFTGYVTQDKLLPLYHAADVFVLAARPEQHWGIPNVVVEAMAAGVPAVCTALPSIPEIIEDRKNGWLLSTPEPEGIVQALTALARQPELRREWGERAAGVVAAGWDVTRNSALLRVRFETILGKQEARSW